MAKQTTWHLFDAKENIETKETELYYTDGTRKLGFVPHPTRAFVYEAITLDGLLPKDFRKLITKWLENAVGPKESYYDRIISFKS